MLEKIVCVDAMDFPQNVEDYCIENEIQTHYQNDVIILKDDGNPFSEWLKEQGYKFSDDPFGDYIAIIST